MLFPATVRYLHEPLKFAVGTIFLNETSGLKLAGAGCDSHMSDVATTDVGLPVQTAIATGPATFLTGKQWVNIPGIVGGGGTILTITTTGFLGGVAGITTVAGVPVSQIQVQGFGFTIPAGATVSTVLVIVQHAQVVISFTAGTFIVCLNGAGVFPFAGALARNRIDINGTVKTVSAGNSTALGNCAVHVLTAGDVEFDFSTLGLTAADLNGETYTLKVEGDYPHFGAPAFAAVEHVWNQIRITAGYGVDVDALTINQVVATRVRSADLTALLVDQDRYITHFNSTAGNRIGHAHSLLIAEVSV